MLIAAGVAFRLLGLKASNALSRRDAYFVVTTVWVLFTIFGMMPFLIGGYLHSVTDAFFETISGFTTTGATIIDYPERLPRGLLFWRSITQWIGGLGIVFIHLAPVLVDPHASLLPRPQARLSPSSTPSSAREPNGFGRSMSC